MVKASLYATSYPRSRIVELSASDAPNFGEEEVVAAGKVVMDEWGVERFSKQFFGRAVVWRGVKGADSQREGAVDDACGWQGIRIWIVLIVECCGSTDEWWKESRQGRRSLRHDGLLPRLVEKGMLESCEGREEVDGQDLVQCAQTSVKDGSKEMRGAFYNKD